jgi:hypothetical protein
MQACANQRRRYASNSDSPWFFSAIITMLFPFPLHPELFIQPSVSPRIRRVEFGSDRPGAERANSTCGKVAEHLRLPKLLPANAAPSHALERLLPGQGVPHSLYPLDSDPHPRSGRTPIYVFRCSILPIGSPPHAYSGKAHEVNLSSSVIGQIRSW